MSKSGRKKVSLDYFNKHITNYKKEDLQKKIDIASNILKYCQCDSHFNNRTILEKQTSIEKCSDLTGVEQETLSALDLLEQKTTNFEKCLLEQKQMLHDNNYDYCRIKKQLIESYTKNFQIPTDVKTKKEFEGYKKHFTFLLLPGTKSSIIVEKPEAVQERHRFLRTKMMYREEKKHLVYIGKVNILLNHGKFSSKEDTVDVNSRFIIGASPTLGALGYIYCSGNTKQFLTSWIEEKIIPVLPQEMCVIIFQENVINSESEINSFTSKIDMIKWLKRNNINHDPKMHRADLFKLINAFKRGEQLSPAEEAFRAHGHFTLRKKKCNINTNYFDPFWDFLIHELNNTSEFVPTVRRGLKHHANVVTSTVNTIVQNVPLDYWENLEGILLEKEREIHNEDLEMENVIDKLVTMVKYQELPEGVKLDEYTKTVQPHVFLADSLRDLYKQSAAQNYEGLSISK